MVRTGDKVFGIVADSPGLWENRCQMLLDPSAHRCAVLTGDGCDPYPLVIKPPEDARDTYQYAMDGWQVTGCRRDSPVHDLGVCQPGPASLRRPGCCPSGRRQLPKAWNRSIVEAILRNTSYFLRRSADSTATAGIRVAGHCTGSGWKAMGDRRLLARRWGWMTRRKRSEANRAVFWTRMDYEVNGVRP